MNVMACRSTGKFVKNIALVLMLILILISILPSTLNIVYASQYRENTGLDEINDDKYPGYKQLLKSMKAEHPNWSFTLFYTGLNWSDVIYNETNSHGSNLIQGKTGEWLCNASSCLDENGNPISYEGSNWYCPSTKAVSYYMDPRNFLYSNKIFQFERLSYSDNTYSVDGVEKILAGTFMSNTSPKDYYGNSNYSSSTFAQIMYDAGVEKRVSPYHIASRIRQEIVKSGGGPSNSVTGTVAGYEGVYNFFNYGATTGSRSNRKRIKICSG